MRVSQATHQCASLPFDYFCLGVGDDGINIRYGSDLCDAFSFDENVSSIRQLPRRVEYLNVENENDRLLWCSCSESIGPLMAQHNLYPSHLQSDNSWVSTLDRRPHSPMASLGAHAMV